ncbi:unnamed protein product [Nippostrongylus brasiliensis]|uniref:TSC22 domain family protein 1-like n=1 Tax=Nippostrongylus brasiliensis TaxID=27835 RepID=A0A0N4YVW5_NIPBR|nr:unnamed protein product [Nippostrongylus brasiliensis]
MATLLCVVSKFRGRKRGLVDLGSPTSMDGDVNDDHNLVSAVAQLSTDDSTPFYIKTIFAYLLDAKDKMESLMAENLQLHGEIRRLREENTGLKQKLVAEANAPILSSLYKSNVSSSRAPLDSVVKNHALVQTDVSHGPLECTGLLIVGALVTINYSMS